MITFNSAALRYPNRDISALQDVSFHVDPGEFVFLTGASGSGKSSILRLILAEYRPTAGQVLVDGVNIKTLKNRRVPKFRRRIGMVFQDFRLLPKKTVAENVAFALQVTGASSKRIREKVPQTLEMVGLAGLGNRMPYEISGGEQQRVCLARAIVNEPTLLLADEPTGNLDPEISMEIVKLFVEIGRRGTTIVMATHDSGIVNQLRRRVIRLDKGKIIQDQEYASYGRGQ